MRFGDPMSAIRHVTQPARGRPTIEQRPPGRQTQARELCLFQPRPVVVAVHMKRVPNLQGRLFWPADLRGVGSVESSRVVYGSPGERVALM